MKLALLSFYPCQSFSDSLTKTHLCCDVDFLPQVTSKAKQVKEAVSASAGWFDALRCIFPPLFG